jgi:hypothetical protein
MLLGLVQDLSSTNVDEKQVMELPRYELPPKPPVDPSHLLKLTGPSKPVDKSVRQQVYVEFPLSAGLLIFVLHFSIFFISFD